MRQNLHFRTCQRSLANKCVRQSLSLSLYIYIYIYISIDKPVLWSLIGQDLLEAPPRTSRDTQFSRRCIEGPDLHSASFSSSPTLTCMNIQSNQCVQPIRYRTTGFNWKTGFDRETGFNQKPVFHWKLDYGPENWIISRKTDLSIGNWIIDW